MRVLHLINSLQMGGAERMLADIVPRLRRLGVESSILSLARGSAAIESALRDKAAAVDCNFGRSRHPYLPWAMASAGLSLRRARADLVHAHLFPAQLVAAAVSPLLKPSTPLLITEHSTHSWRRDFRVLGPVETWMYRRATCVACISQATLEALAQSVPGVDASQWAVIPNGVDLSRFSAKPPQGSQMAFPQTLISVGRLVSPKGMHRLVAAVARMRRSVPVVIVGDGPMRQTLQAQIDSLGLGDRVKLLGNRDDVPDLLKKAALYVQPSEWEGFGLAAVEAMASGLAVIHSGCPGLAEVVGPGGLAVDCNDPAVLANAIDTLLDDSARRQQLATAALARAQRFSVEETASAYAVLYGRMLQK